MEAVLGKGVVRILAFLPRQIGVFYSRESPVCFGYTKQVDPSCEL